MWRIGDWVIGSARRRRVGSCFVAAAGALFVGVSAARGVTIDDARTLVDEGKFQQAIDLLTKEVSENPAYESARVLLASAYEKAGLSDDAVSTWKDILSLSKNEETLRKARMAVARLRRLELDKLEAKSEAVERPKDPIKLDMPEIDWAGLEVVEDNKYKPPILPPPFNWEVPPFAHETQHFTVYTANERLSKVIGERAEIYLAFMNKALFGGRSWAVRVPILVYSTVDDYNKHGGPVGSGGVTYGHITGKTQAVVIFQLKPDFSQGKGRGGGRASSSGKEVWKYGIESVLPHELTHAVMNEFFSSRKIPQWMNEAVAGRFEQTRDHYGEAARLARSVVAGEYFRMRDLFDQEGYPERIGLFYEQSAIVVLYLFEAGPEAMHAFLSELAAGNGHDAACAAALGIPEEGAVEEFERRWVEWMRQRYAKDLGKSSDNPDALAAGKSDNAVFQPWINELDTVESISSWREVDLTSLDSFKGVGAAKKDWSVENGMLRCKAEGTEGASLLAIRMNETTPMAITCDVKFLGSPGERNHLFGFAQLDAEGNDTRIEAVGPLRDNASHKVVCVWSNDLTVYIDGTCTGRFPAWQISGDARDVDFPIALVAYGPVEVQNLRVAKIERFSDKPVVAAADTQKDQRQDQPGRSRSREDRRRRRGEEKKGP